MQHPAQSRRRSKAPEIARFALAAVLLVTTAPAALAQPSFVSSEQVWITLGTDAFRSLRDVPELSLLPRHAERSGVVMTQVRVEDLAKISLHLHETTGRCAGFMAHRDLEQAERSLEIAANGTTQRGGVEYEINQQALVPVLEALLEKPPILDTIDQLSNNFANRFFAHPSGVAAAQWIHDLWAGYAEDRSDITVDLVEHSGFDQRSVVLTIPGTLFPDEVVVLGGHLDSIAPGSSNPNFSAPGADDDASGIAVLSEIIRALVNGDFFPQRTIQFMGYAAEEVGLVGSQDIAANYAAASTDVVAVLQLDMTDFFGSAEDMGVLTDFTDSALTNFVTELIDTYQPELTWAFTACGFGCSDHAAWTQEGFPASMVFESRFGQHNPFIHSTADTLATLGNQVDHAFKFARLGLAFAVEIGNVNAVVSEIFLDGFESGSTSAWSQTVP